MTSIDLGNYTLDSLQIFFPWDDDLYTYLKDRGFARETGMKALPLVYSDNIEHHTGKKESKRKYVIPPEKFGKTYEQVGWKETEKPSQPIIPSEKPMVNVKIDGKNIIFTILPRISGKNEYHLEYSSMSAFGKLYGNWSAIYFSTKEFARLVSVIKERVRTRPIKVELQKETKQNQREEIDYVEVPIIRYEFSLGEFEYAKAYVKLSGFKEDVIPSLIFNAGDKESQLKMSPVAKVGILHTSTKTGFDERNAQSVVKISQDRMTISGRGKKTKVKGLIKTGNYSNLFILDAEIFVATALKLNELLKKA